MTGRSNTDTSLTPVKRALITIRDLRAQLAEAELARHEPIAIVGMGLRLPGGANNAESFKRLLWSGTDAVTAIPGDRWRLDDFYAEDPDAPGKMTTRYGAFLEGIDQFDAEFFGISPREASSLDPQQRLLMEVSWEALEDAGHSPAELNGSSTGVYLGIANSDYGRAIFSQTDLVDAYFSTGNAFSVAAGRLSYFLGLLGPSIAVDTACSSSLVALHLACQGLRLRECDRALVGGVNIILTPEMNINFSKARMMAADGRCKTFDAKADGYVRGEGCAVVVLRRLRDALADGDRILALVRGSAINQDGRSGGLTAPNGPAQEAVIRRALASAELAPDAISYIEAHGTGTPLGDPIEVGALGAIFGAGRNTNWPLMIGSVKTNIGHLEAAAGIAGLIKVVLGLQQREIPPHLHFHSGNPHIDWQHLPIIVPTAVQSWTPIDGRRLAGISSFGFSGTNAHVIVEEAPATPVSDKGVTDRPLHLLTLSAREDAALADLARQYETKLAGQATAADICFTANAGRSHFNHRLGVVGVTPEELRQGLACYASGTVSPAVAFGNAEGRRPRMVFLFTGQGAQHVGMGRDLYDTSPVFRRKLDECAEGLVPYLDRGLLDLMFSSDGDTINDTINAQPVTFAIEVALAALWRSWGIRPVAVLGHSLGEYAAAHIAGMLSLGDALRLVAERGRLTRELALPGAMAALLASHEAVAAELEHSAGALTVAAYNGPEHFVVSGSRSAIDAAIARLTAAGRQAKLLHVSYAAHCNLVDPVLPAFRKVLDTIDFKEPSIALISNVTGRPAGIEELGNSDYWLQQMRAPVQFAKSITAVAEQGVTHFIEIGPHPVLLSMGIECLGDAGIEWLPSLRRGQADWPNLLESLQRLYVSGANIDWTEFDRNYTRRRVELPTYPFRRRRHWMDVKRPQAATCTNQAEDWDRLVQMIDREADRGPVGVDLSNYADKWASLERLTNAYTASVLRRAGIFSRPGERLTPQQVREKLGSAEHYQHLLVRWLSRLVDTGQLRADGEAFVADRPLPAPNLDARWAEAEAALADNQPLLAYIRHCGSLLHDVLVGRQSPVETLFPDGSFEIAEGLYEHSATLRYINGVAAGAMAAQVAARTSTGAIRVLEIGAGTGSSTASLLPLLPADRTEYWYTDITPAFFDHARERFSAFPFLRFGTLDLERDPSEQGFPNATFDIVFSSNTVHATRNVRTSLARLHDLLAPGGTLLLVESTEHFAWLDMTIGMFEGWQHFADDLRSDNPLLPPATWINALSDAGFTEIAAAPRAGSPAEGLGQHLLVARISAPVEFRADVERQAVSAPATVPETDPKVIALATRVRDAMPSERGELLYNFVLSEVVAVLKMDPSQPPGAQNRLLDLGFDSLMAVQFRNRLDAGLSLGRKLPASLLFDYPTIEAIKDYLLDVLFPTVAEPAAAKSATLPILGEASVAAMSDDEIARLLIERLDSE